MNEPQPFPVAANRPRTGLSVTSLVLGIFSLFCLFIFTGIPAIVTGHVARARARKQPELYGGAGMALAGLILGYVSLVTTFVAAALVLGAILPALAKVKQQAQGNMPSTPAAVCANNMQQIGLAARIWSNDHNDQFPPDFLSMSNELGSPGVLICPEDTTKTAAPDWSHFNPALNVSYEFLTPNAKEADVMTKPAFRCPIHGNVGLGNGSVRQNAEPGRRPR